MRRYMLGALGVLAFTSAQAAVLPAPAPSVEIAPHRAVYDMMLGDAGPGANIVGARGRMVSEWRRNCEGWTVTQRVDLALSGQGGSQIVTQSNYSSFESFDGRSLRFSSRNLDDGTVSENLQGAALLEADGEGGTATFTAPAGLKFDLPPGTVFPTVHVTHLIEAARAGKAQLTRTVFDGADNEGPVAVNAVILAPMSPSAGGEAEGLRDRPSWYMQMAFFPESSNRAEPTYELGARIFDNGVADNLNIDYGDFNLKARLDSIEPLEKPEC